MDLALDTLPVETATVLATDAEAWVMADMFDESVARKSDDRVAPTVRPLPGVSPRRRLQ